MDTRYLHAVSVEHLLASIAKLQAVQKRNRPDSDESIGASESLAPLFAEMARRQGARS